MLDSLFGSFSRDVGMAHFAVLYRAFQRFDAGIHVGFSIALGNLRTFFGMSQRRFRMFDQNRAVTRLAMSHGLIGVFQSNSGMFFGVYTGAKQQQGAGDECVNCFHISPELNDGVPRVQNER